VTGAPLSGADRPPGIAATMAAIGAAIGDAAAPGRPAETDRPAGVELPSSPAANADPVAAHTADLSASIDTVLRAMVAPMVEDWLNAHLPEIVEAATHAEIKRLTGLNGQAA